MGEGPRERFTAGGFVALRTPLLPLREVAEIWSAGLEVPEALDRDEDLDAAVEADRTRMRSRIRDALTRPEVREAIFIASPDLDDGVEAWRRDPDSERGRRAERALVRYLARMAARATPFGLFAGCSVARVGKVTRLVIEGRDAYERHTRLDVDYLARLSEHLTSDPRVREELSFRPNSSLYRTFGDIRFVESRWNGKVRSYHLVAVKRSRYVDAALGRAVDGATLQEIASSLQQEGLSTEAADRYAVRLVEEQVLIGDFGLTVTGQEPLEPLVEQLRKAESTAPVGDRLDAAGAALAEIDGAGLGVAPERYRAVAETLEELPTDVDLPRLFQVDMIKPADAATLAAGVVDEVVRGITILHRLARPNPDGELDRFRAEFRRRYEGRAVPLVEVMDGEAGIGFGPRAEPTPLLKEIVFPARAEEGPRAGRRDRVLLARLVEAAAAGLTEIALSARDVDAMAEGDPDPLPPSLAAMATVAASSDEALDRGAFEVHLRNAGGPSGARLLGRFCHADHVLRESVERYLEDEEALDPDAVFAEIVHLPEGRVGNILLRPQLRSYEIPYLGRSGAAPSQQIPVTDLLVSLEGERIVLTSQRLGRRVIPRLTSAHNFSRRSVPVYRFLCALQSDGFTEGVAWNWGPLAAAPFLPRVRFGRLVLSLATWRVTKEELRRLGRHREASLLLREIRTWRVERNLPRHVVLADFDNTLLVDLENVLSIESFVHLVRGREEARLEELWPDPGRLCARGPEGAFVHELVVPLTATRSPRASAAATRRAGSRDGFRRTFTVGSEWLFASLYTGEATADEILRTVVAPLREKVLGLGAADSWFFIRYGDPDHHLRVRFHGRPDRLHDEVLPELEVAVAPLLEDGRVHRLTLDTYVREVERYGGPDAIILAEQIFYADSDAVIEIMRRLERGAAGADERWRLALRGMDALLSDLGLTPAARFALMRRVRHDFAREHRLDARAGRAIGERFRDLRESLEDLLDPASNGHALEAGFDLLRLRSERVAPIAAKLRSLEAAGRLVGDFEGIAASLLHMHANRLLRGAQRAQELMLYSFLARLYEARLRRVG